MKKPVAEKALIPGPAGELEALLSVADDYGDSIAIICHPHPLHGGSMHNKVVHYTARAMHNTGMPVLRFNFRGVGRSTGEFDNTVGEADDLKTAAGWLRQKYPGRDLVVAGFSFGSYIAASQAPALAATRLISIAPPVNLYDFYPLTPQMPWLVIMGDGDEVVPVPEVRQWLENEIPGRQVVWMTGASHFFHGRLPELSRHIEGWLSTDIV